MRDHQLLPLAGLAAMLCLCGALYAIGLNGPPLLDDISVLLPLTELDAASWQAWLGEQLFSDRGALGRPVAMASFLFNAVNHGDDLRYWNAFNVFLHLCSGVLIYWLTLRLAAMRQQGEEPVRAEWLALLVAGLWLLHPLQVSTVLYTVQRMAQLSAFFLFAGLIAYVAGRQRQIRRAAGGWPLIGAAFLLCFPLSVLSKENGLLFPLFVALVELVFFRLEGSAKTRRQLAGLMIGFVFLPVLAAGILLLVKFDTLVLAGYVSRDFTLAERLMTELRIVVFYLYQLLVPVQGSMGFFHDDFPVSHGMLDPPGTLLSLLLLLVLVILAWVLRRRAPLVSFGLLFFFIAHLLESTLLPLELVFEHRNYLASYGIMLVLGAGMLSVLKNPRILGATALILLLALSSLTAARSATWGSAEKFYRFAYTVHPDSGRMTTIIANFNADAGQYDLALQLLGKFDNVGFAVNRLYVMCQRDGFLDDERIANAAAALKGPVEHHALNSLFKLANLGLDERCTFSSAAYQALLDAVFRQPIAPVSKARLLMYRAHFHYREDERDKAIGTLENIYAMSPDSPVPLFLATEWLIEYGDMERAREVYTRARADASASKSKYSEYTDRIDALFDAS